MRVKQFCRTGLKVSEICLGTMTFGNQADETTARAIMDKAFDAGVYFFDTADAYPLGATPEMVGRTEEIIGRWLRGRRDDIVLATKCRNPIGPRPNDSGLSRRHILDAVEQSLRRLQTDYIDLYQAHRDDPDTPLDETLAAFDELVKQGIVRAIGASNYSAPRLAEARRISEERGYARYESIQPPYSLVQREEYERELEPYCREYGVGVIPYSSLASGFLTGKYRPGQDLPATPRAGGIQQKYMHERGFAVLGELDRVAEAHGATPAQVALAWLLAKPVVTSPIVGVTRQEHLDDAVAAVDLELTPEEVAELEAPYRPHAVAGH